MSPLPADDVHRPVLLLNAAFHTGGPGLYSYYGCSCGQKPATVPEHVGGRSAWYVAHRAALGLTHIHGLSEAVHGPGYPAEGLTWRQWHSQNPGVNPFTGEVYDPLPPRTDPSGTDPSDS